MSRRPKWSDDDLRRVIPQVTSWRQAAAALGISASGHSYAALRSRTTGLALSTEHFLGHAWNKGKGAGRDLDAQRAAKRRWYDSNRGVYLDRNRRRRAEVAAAVRELRSGPCADCDRTFPYYCMDFDHRPDEVKVFEIAAGVSRNYSLGRILAEVGKCDLVCAVCHRIRTATRGGYATDPTALAADS